MINSFKSCDLSQQTIKQWYTSNAFTIFQRKNFLSVQFSSVAQSCPTLCDPMNRSTPGLPVPHQLPEFTQTHIHESMMPSSHLILCRPLLLLPQALPASGSFPVSQLFT